MADSTKGFKKAPATDLNTPDVRDFLGEAAVAGSAAPPAAESRRRDMAATLEHVLHWMAQVQSGLGLEPGGAPEVRLRALMHLRRLIGELSHRSLSTRMIVERQAALVLGGGQAETGHMEAGGAETIRMAVEAGIDRREIQAWSILADLEDDHFAALVCEMQLRQKEFQETAHIYLADAVPGADDLAEDAPDCQGGEEESFKTLGDELETALDSLTEAVKNAEDRNWQEDSKKNLRQRLKIFEHMLNFDHE